MISALKRLVNTDSTNTSNNSNGQSTNITSPANKIAQNALATTSLINNGMQMISQSLQKKFSRGVNYNMKIVIRGDCNVGKTCLWLRLQGQGFKEAYESSDEIKVANIQWNYKTTDDVVKVEIWDVVDRSKKKRNLLQQRVTSSNTLKFDHSINEPQMPVEASLDAEFIDVYKNANGCILVYDITKQWTWDYIERELPKIPTHIPVLIIGNHRDMHHHRTIDELKCKFFLESLNRGSLGSAVRYTETSMRTGYVLSYLYKFFNIPFLQLQRENLMQQLEINAKETDAICEELQAIEENIEVDYDNFIDGLNSKRRQQQEDNAKDVLKNALTIEQARKLAQEKEAALSAAKERAEAQLSEPKKVINNIINKINTKVQQNLQQPQQVSMSVTLDPSKPNPHIPSSNSKSPINLNLEELTHDDELNKFLDDPVKAESKTDDKKAKYDDEDDDENSNNPMVAALKEEIDSSDEESLNNQKIVVCQNMSDNEPESVKKQENLVQSQDFLYVNKMTSHNSTSSNASSNLAQNTSLKNVSNLDSFSTATSLSLVNCDTGSQASYTLTTIEDQMAGIKFSNDDFEFLEKVSSEKKAKSKSKKSSKATGDELDESKSKSKKKSKSKAKDLDEFFDSSEEKKEKKKTKKSKESSKSSRTKTKNVQSDEDEEELGNGNGVSIKRDLDYEEL